MHVLSFRIPVNFEVCLTFCTKYFTLIEYAKMEKFFFQEKKEEDEEKHIIFSIVHSIIRSFAILWLNVYFHRTFIVNSHNNKKKTQHILVSVLLHTLTKW